MDAGHDQREGLFLSLLLIVTYVFVYNIYDGCHMPRIHQAVSEGAKVIDVDGMYLYKMHPRVAVKDANVAPLTLPIPPLSGWESVTESNLKALAKKVPRVTSGTYDLL